MKRTIIIFLTLLLSLALLLPMYAGDEDRTGTASGTQVQIPVGGRDVALAGATVAFTQGVEAIYWNPAGLSMMESKAAVLFSTMNYLFDIRVNYFAIGVNAGRFGHVGVSLKSLGFGDIPMTTNGDMDGAYGRTYSPTFATLGVTYSRRLTDVIQVGINGKLITESVPRASASAFAFDVGIQYRQIGGLEGLNLGLLVSNIGTNMTFTGSGLLTNFMEAGGKKNFVDRTSSSNQLPASVDMGLSYTHPLMINSELSVSSAFQSNNFENDAIKTGVEYGFNKMVFARLGYVYSMNTDSEDRLFDLTAGLGLAYQLGGSNLMFDYTFRNCQYFDASHIFSFKVAF